MKLFIKSKDIIPGGLADRKTDKDFDQEALAAGQKVEMEHTKDPKIAREIARDHLAEDPNYYKKLAKMEKAGAAEPGYYDPEQIRIKREEEAGKKGEPGEIDDADSGQSSVDDPDAADPGAQELQRQKEEDKRAEKSTSGMGGMISGAQVSPVETGEDYVPRDKNQEPLVHPLSFHRPINPPAWVEVGPTRGGANQWKLWSDVVGARVPALSPAMHLRQFKNDPQALEEERNILARSISKADPQPEQDQEQAVSEEDPHQVVAEGKKLLNAIPQLNENQLRKVAKRIWGDDYEYGDWADEDYIRSDVTGSIMDMVESALMKLHGGAGEDSDETE